MAIWGSHSGVSHCSSKRILKLPRNNEKQWKCHIWCRWWERVRSRAQVWRGQVCAMAAQYPPSSEQAGRDYSMTTAWGTRVTRGGWGGEWAGWCQLLPPTLQVTRKTLSSQAGWRWRGGGDIKYKTPSWSLYWFGKIRSRRNGALNSAPPPPPEGIVPNFEPKNGLTTCFDYFPTIYFKDILGDSVFL